MAAAEYFGFEFIARQAELSRISILDKRTGVPHEIEILEVFPYESSRKRMSVIVRLPPGLLELCGGGARDRVYCKGMYAPPLDVCNAHARIYQATCHTHYSLRYATHKTENPTSRVSM